MGFEGRRVDTALQNEIFITLRIGRNVKRYDITIKIEK